MTFNVPLPPLPPPVAATSDSSAAATAPVLPVIDIGTIRTPPVVPPAFDSEPEDEVSFPNQNEQTALSLPSPDADTEQDSAPTEPGTTPSASDQTVQDCVEVD